MKLVSDPKLTARPEAQDCHDGGDCPVVRAIEVLDGKWTILIVRDLLSGTKRFTELRRSLGAVSPKTLTDRLRALEERGLLERQVFAEIPPRVEYTLTPAGHTLRPILDALSARGASNRI